MRQGCLVTNRTCSRSRIRRGSEWVSWLLSIVFSVPWAASFCAECLEPISKSSEEDNEAGELDKAEEVLSVVLPADEDATLPLYPGEEALDEPAPHVTA